MTSSENSSQETTAALPRTRWGRSRIGGSGGALIAVSLIIGAILACGFGWLFTILDSDNPRPLLLFVIGAVFTFPFSVLLPWVILVDRSTLAGAPDDPESSIESRWIDKAASGAFPDMIAVLGLGAAAFTLVDIPISTGLALAGAFCIATADFALRYLLAKRSDS